MSDVTKSAERAVEQARQTRSGRHSRAARVAG